MGLFGGYNLPTGGTGATGYPGTTAIQDFTTNSTWSKCPGAVYVKVISIGGGGGGGNGLNAPSTITGAVVLGGAGGGGGGISEQTFAACAIGATASVIIGAGGGISINQAGSGGASRWCTTAGCDVCAAGGKGGYGGRDLYPTYGAFPSGSFSNGGTPCEGGAGSYADGNDGGQAFYRSSPFTLDALPASNCSSPYTTRAGGAGGSFQYPSTAGSNSAASTAQTVCGIELTTYGKGGNGGQSRFTSGATNGTAGQAGFVRVIQYF